MNSLQKIALSFLFSIVLFAITAVLGYTGGFELLEMHFYEPRKAGTVYGELSRIGGEFDGYYSEVNVVFSEFLAQSSTNSYLQRTPQAQDVSVRKSLEGYLFMRISGFEGMRLVESDGEHIHYSTYSSDILSETDSIIAYKNYSALNDIPYSLVEAPDTGIIATSVEYIMNCVHLYLDGERNRFVFSYPLFDAYTAYRGTFIFYVDVEGFMRTLSSHGAVALNTHAVAIGNMGLVIDMPVNEREYLVEQVQSLWAQHRFGVEHIALPERQTYHRIGMEKGQEEGLSLYLLTRNNSKSGLYMGAIRQQGYFSISPIERILLFLTLFITSFLVVFLLLNIKQDDMVVIQSRVRHFEYVLLREYINRRETDSWEQLSKEITRRRMDVNEEFKKSLGRRAKRHNEEVDELIDRCWREVAAAMGGNVMVVQGHYVPGAVQNAYATGGTVPLNANAGQIQNQRDLEPVIVHDAEDIAELEEEPAEVTELAGSESISEINGTDDDLAELEFLDDEDDDVEVAELEPLEAAGKDEEAVELEELESADVIEELEAVDTEEEDRQRETERAERAKKNKERKEELNKLDSADSIAMFMNRLAEENAENNSMLVEEEMTIEEYMAENSMLKRPSENAEKIRKQTEENFKVTMLDFSSLDKEQ